MIDRNPKTKELSQEELNTVAGGKEAPDITQKIEETVLDVAGLESLEPIDALTDAVELVGDDIANRIAGQGEQREQRN